MSNLKKRGDRSGRNSGPDGAHPPSRSHILLFSAGSFGLAFLIVVYLALTWRNFAGVTRAIDAFTELFSDFVIYYYPMGEMIFSTELPVSGFLYSPFIAIMMAVFPYLGQNASLIIWGILQVLSVIFYLLLFRRLVPARLPVQLLFVFLALSSYPLILNFIGGQVSVFIVVALLGILVANERGSRTAGAGLLAFAASFKFYPALFLAPFVNRRGLRFLFFAAAACGTLLFVVPGLFLGIGDTLRFYGALLDAFRDSAWVTANPHSQYFPNLVFRLAEALGYNAQAFLPLLHAISYTIAASNMGLILLAQHARLRYADLWSFQLVFLTVPFILKTSWPHDFVFLPFTQALLAWTLLEDEKTVSETGNTREPIRMIRNPRSRIAVSVLLLLSISISNIVFFNIFGDFTLYGFCGFLFWANLLLLIALYVQLLPTALRRFQKPPEKRIINCK